MRDGIEGIALPGDFPYATIINTLCDEPEPGNYFPCLVGAVKFNETGLGYGDATENDISADGGHGIMQLTSSFPDNWQDPTTNIDYAITNFLIPAYTAWKAVEQGDNLVRCIAATYNAGYSLAQAGHNAGNVDLYTTNNYGARALSVYQMLVNGDIPVG
jgi:hypothetical protein